MKTKRLITLAFAVGIVSGMMADNTLGRKDFIPSSSSIAYSQLDDSQLLTINPVPNRFGAPKANVFEVTSGDMDSKRLTYVAPDSYYPLQAQTLYAGGGCLGIYAHYTADMMSHFKGNKLTKINTVVYDGAPDVVVKVLDSNFEPIFEEDAEIGDTSLGWGYAISVDTDIELTGEDIYVGYMQYFNPGDKYTAVLLQRGRMNQNSMLVEYGDRDGLYALSRDFAGVPVIWCETEGDAGLCRNDVKVESVGGGRVNVDGLYNITGSFVNMGTEPIRFVTVGYETADGSLNEAVLDAGEYLPYMNMIQFNMPARADAGAGIFDRTVTVTKINGENDEYPEDNSGNSVLFSIDNPLDRNIAIEEYTGSWCGYCVRGIVSKRLLEEMYGDRVVYMEMHTQDYMSYDHGEVYKEYGAQIPGWPQAWVNRVHMSDPYFGITQFNESGFGMGDEVAWILEQPVEVALDMDISLSDDKKKIDVTTNVTFSLNVDELSKYYTLGYMLLENGLEDMQYNYYSEEYPNHWPKDELPYGMQPLFDLPYEYEETYDNVVCEEVGAMGIEGSLTGAVAKGGTASHNIEISTNAIIEDCENAAVAAFIIDKATGEILNITCKTVKASSIKDVMSDTSHRSKEYYDLMGRRLNANNLPQNDVIIVRENGKAHKIFTR